MTKKKTNNIRHTQKWKSNNSPKMITTDRKTSELWQIACKSIILTLVHLLVLLCEFLFLMVIIRNMSYCMECTGTTLKKSSLHTPCTNFGFIVINYWCYAFKTGKKINHKRPKWLVMALFRVNTTNLTKEQNMNIIAVILSRVIPQYITSPT